MKKTILEPTWEAQYGYSPAVVTEGGRTAWLAGHVGFMDDQGKLLAGDFEAQARQALKNTDATLRRLGGSLKDIVWMTVTVSDARFSQVFTNVRKEVFGTDFPASTLLTVSGFALPEIMVEITPVAVLQ